MQYSVEPGPCGVTVPNLNAPQCSTPDTTDTPTVAAGSSAVTTPTQDNTAVIVASVFAAMFFILSLGLIGYIYTSHQLQKGLREGSHMIYIYAYTYIVTYMHNVKPMQHILFRIEGKLISLFRHQHGCSKGGRAVRETTRCSNK